MAKDHVHQSHPDIVNRLKRAKGHVHRVIAMFDEGRSCVELVQQLFAVEKAIGGARRRLIHDHIDHCLDGAVGPARREAANELKAICRCL